MFIVYVSINISLVVTNDNDYSEARDSRRHSSVTWGDRRGMSVNVTPPHPGVSRVRA